MQCGEMCQQLGYRHLRKRWLARIAPRSACCARRLWPPFEHLKIAHNLKSSPRVRAKRRRIAHQPFKAAAARAGLARLIEHGRGKFVGQATPAKRQRHAKATAPGAL